jgi:TolA-binding protein
MQKTLKLLMQSLDNDTMRHRLLFLLAFLLFGIFLGQNLSAENFPDLGSKYRKASMDQGSLVLRKAEQFFQDRFYDQCIQELNSFGIVYPSHPQKIQAWALMSQAFQKKREFRKAAEVDLAIFLENPTTEEGYLAYLSAGRSYLKVGETEFAKRIFSEIQDSSYFPEISQQANLELRQWKVLGSSAGQNEDFFEK